MLGSPEDAYKAIQNLRERIGGGKEACSMDFLYHYIKNHNSARKKKTAQGTD